MNEKEAKKVIKILKPADGGCEFCVDKILRRFNFVFPEFKHLTKLKKSERDNIRYI